MVLHARVCGRVGRRPINTANNEPPVSGNANRGFVSYVGRHRRHELYMDLLRMIGELQAEKERLDEAIQALERLSARKLRRRGRPPRWLKSEIQAQSSETEKAEENSNGN